MNQQEIEQVLSGKKQVETLPESSGEIIFKIITKKFQARYKKIIHGFDLSDNRKNSPLNFWFQVVPYKDVRFSIFPVTDWYSRKDEGKPIRKIGISYQDAGVHHGSAYGNEVDEVNRYTSVKHLAKLIPKMEEVYDAIEAVTDKYRDETIKGRIDKLQYDVSEKLHDLEFEVESIKQFKKKHASGNYLLAEQLDELIEEKLDLVKKEETKVKKLPEFTNPRKVLHID